MGITYNLYKMDGVFINLTEIDITIKDKTRIFCIRGNKDLVTPIKDLIQTESLISGIVSTPLADEDVHTIQSTQMFNTVYNKIERAEQNALMVQVTINSPYIKYPFTEHQIEKINKISTKRTRLFLLSEKDAEVWSSGNFECPFRNYRLFVSNPEGSLIEYPIPKTYLDSVLSGFKKIIGS
jgi:hypothetical protein